MPNRKSVPVFVLLIISTSFSALGQVMENHNLVKEAARASSLMAGARAADVPHHVHYDLKLYDRNGRMTTGSYDIYRDPGVYSRVDIAAGSYRYSMIDGYYNHRIWYQQSEQKPLKLLDFQEIFIEPLPALDRLLKTRPLPRLHPRQFHGEPLLCASDNAGTTLCFDPLVHVFAWSQTFNQTVMYADWRPIGTHTVPCDIRIYEDKHLLVEATGSVQPVKKFARGLFVMPPESAAAAEPEEHKILRYGNANAGSIYGNVMLQLTANAKGRVKKAVVIDSDDKHLEGQAKHFARKTIYEPYIVNGQPQPFETTIVYHEFPPPE